MGLTSAGDLAKVTAKSELEWHNGVHATRERQPSERLQGAPAHAKPHTLVAHLLVVGAQSITANGRGFFTHLFPSPVPHRP